MAHVTTEAERDDAKRDAWYDHNVRECPKCGGELTCTYRDAGSRYGPSPEPPCELWECQGQGRVKGCGHEEEG
jgi:hypothetical protein